MKPNQRETKAVAEVLERGAESSEELAKLAIEAYWEAFSERTATFALLTVGGVYQTVGPFSTTGQASRFIKKSGAERGWIVMGRTEAGWLRHLAEKVDLPAAPKGDWAVLHEDARAFRNGWRGKQSERERFLS